MFFSGRVGGGTQISNTISLGQQCSCYHLNELRFEKSCTLSGEYFISSEN